MEDGEDEGGLRRVIPAVGKLDGEGLDAGVGGEFPLEVLLVARVVAENVGGWGGRGIARVDPGLGADGAGI